MVTQIQFTEQDWREIPSGFGNGIDISTFDTDVDLFFGSTGTGLSHIIVSGLEGTSPASWSSGEYWLGIELELLEPNATAGAGATITTIKYPILHWKSTETSTAKFQEQAIVLPVMALKRKVNARAKIVAGNGGYTFTSVNANIQALQTIAW